MTPEQKARIEEEERARFEVRNRIQLEKQGRDLTSCCGWIFVVWIGAAILLALFARN